MAADFFIIHSCNTQESKKMIVKLTDGFMADSLQCPEGTRRIEFVDKGGTGLYVEVRATSPGQGTYYLRYKDAGGKTCHQKIGRTTEMELDEARQRAKTLKAQITLGADPRGDRRIKSAMPTLTSFMEDYYFPYVRPRKRTAHKDEELFRLRLKKAFGDQKLNQITRHQIQAFHTAVREEGLAPASCDHYLKLLRHSRNLAVDWGLLDRNPAAGVKQYNEDNKIERYLNKDELRRLLKVLHTNKNRTVCQIALFLLATGARLNEALSARWEYVDREHRVWRIPAADSKSRHMRSVPLNDSAIAVLDQLDTAGNCEHLFINRKTGKAYTTIYKTWESLRAEAGLDRLRLHDLRHSAASYMAQAGVSLYVIQQVLGHSNPSVTQRYAHLSAETLLDAANCTSDVIQGAMPEPA
jgi:integrase